MVTRATRWGLGAALLGLVLSLSAAPLDARLDRPRATWGEPLQLQLLADAPLENLDLAPLENDFEIFSRSSSSSSEGGRTRYRMSLTLYPLRSGRLTVPALTLGRAHSRALPVAVDPAALEWRAWLEPSLPSERQGAILHLQLRDDGSLDWAVPDWREARQLTLQALPETAQTDAAGTLHHFRWRVLPLASGSLSVRWQPLTATKFGQRLRFAIDTLSFPVRALPAYLPLQLPVGKPGLRAGALPSTVLAQRPVQRSIDILAPGLGAESALRLLQIDPAPDVRFYAPSTRFVTQDDGQEALRVTFTGIAQSGATHFPEMRLPYFDPNTQRVESLVLPAHTITVRDPARERLWLGVGALAGLGLLIWLALRAQPWLARWRRKHGWLAKIRKAANAPALYSALTAEAPWPAQSLRRWPAEARPGTDLCLHLERACFGMGVRGENFSVVRQDWLRHCARIPLRRFPLPSTAPARGTAPARIA